MVFEDFIASRTEMTVTQYLNTYLSMNDRDYFHKDCIKVHVYADGMHIEELPNKVFYALYERTDVEGTLHNCEKTLWEYFAKDELKDRYNR
jgi:hypothetical protein